MIAIHGLEKSYGSKRVLRGLDLEVASGEILAIVGPNGAGKTTLLEVLATVILPDGGDTLIGDQEIVREAEAVRRLVGYCPSVPALYPQLSGCQNLEFFAALHGIGDEHAVRHALQVVGLEGDAGVQVQRYSDGMRQRLSLARVLMAGPRVLLLDEPTRSLDPAAASDIRARLRRIAQQDGTTILLVTHNGGEASAAGDRVAFLREGVIAAIGRPDEVLKEEAAWNAS